MRTNKELRRLIGVEPITTFIRGVILRWYGHVMRNIDEEYELKAEDRLEDQERHD